MIKILSWNIQNGKGVDGQISLARITDVIHSMGSADIICLQEVSRGLPLLEGHPPPDQVLELSRLLDGYEYVFGAAIDTLGADGRWQFGNVIFSKLPIVSQSTHVLPRPGDANRRQMSRQATEVVVREGVNLLRVITTHLEFHSAVQRHAQARRLREFHEEAAEEQSMPPVTSGEGPYQPIPRPTDLVMCGDFNMLPSSDEYQALIGSQANVHQNLVDAWPFLYPEKDYPPTCGIYDHEQWSEGSHCRDFFFVGGWAKDRLSRMTVNTKTDASDHQPLMIELA